MALPAQDSFTASSDSSLTAYSSNWTVNAGGFNVIAASDTVRCTTNDDYAVAYWNADSFNADQYAQIAVNIPANALAWPGPAVRVAASANTYYGVSVGNIGGGSYDVYLSKFVAGTLTDLAYVTRSISAGDVVRLEVSGTSLTVKINGTAVSGLTNISDSSISSGYAGICCYDTDSVTTIDNFEGGNLGSAGITGTGSAVIGGISAAGAAAVAARATGAATIGAVAAAGTGTAAGTGITGTGSATIGVITASGAGAAAARANGTATVGAVAGQGAGTVAVGATGSATIGAIAAGGTAWRLYGATVGGVLHRHPTNPRYFANGAGTAIATFGFHTWADIQDSWPTTPIQAFDFDGYLDALVAYGVNFTKAWILESARDWGDSVQWFTPSPWARTGPGNAADGLTKFDLSQLNQAYFDRLRERVIRLGNAGIYVCVQLFQGWHVSQKGFTTGNPWAYHPFNAANNVNGINGDPNADGSGYEIQNGSIPAVTTLQQAYVRKVLDTLNDLDHVLYEINNEGDPTSLTWQRDMVAYLKSYEAGLAKQHLVGMTAIYPGGQDADLFGTANIDWLSPNNGNSYTLAASGTAKSVAIDTDHIDGIHSSEDFVYPALTMGYHAWYMDPWAGETYGTDTRNNATYQRIRATLGYALAHAQRLDLANATPQPGLSSSGYCLAKTTGAAQLLAYQPSGAAFTVNLTGLGGTFNVEWQRNSTGAKQSGGTVSGGAVRTLTPPWAGEPVVAFLELAGYTGSGSAVIGGIVAAGAGAVAIAAAGTAQVGAVVAGGAGAVSVAAAGQAAIGSIVAAGAGSAAAQGAGAAVIGAIVASGSGTVAVGAAGAAQLGLNAGGAASAAVQAVGAAVVGVVTGAGYGTVGSTAIVGSGSAVIGAVSGAGAAVVAVQAAGSADVAVVAGQGAAVVVVAGAGSAVIGAVAAGGFGSADGGIGGIGAAAVGAVAGSGAGGVAVSAAGAAIVGANLAGGAGAASDLPVVGAVGSAVIGGVTAGGTGVVAWVLAVVRVAGPGGRGVVPGPGKKSKLG